MVEPDAGIVLVDGADVNAVDPVALRRRIGYEPRACCRTGGCRN